ncbi:MAG: peptidoglycan-binding protein [Planctomycetota bacterium]
MAYRSAPLGLAFLLVSVSVASAQDDLRTALRSKADEDLFTVLARVAGSGRIDADRAAIQQALQADEVSPALRQLLASATRLRVAEGALVVEGASPAQLRGADLIPGATFAVRREGADLRAEGLEIGPRDGSRYALQSVRRTTKDGRPALQLQVAKDGQGRQVTLPAETLSTSSALVQESPVLRRGDNGEAVKELQERLNEHRKAAGLAPIPTNGEFGPVTSEALRRFQRDHGLSAQGEADPATWRGLRAAPGATTTPSAPAAPATPALWQGDFGQEVSDLQERLNAQRRATGAAPIPVTGRFDEATVAAVRELQRGQGLDPTGVVDANTWSGLLQPDAAARSAELASSPELARDARGPQVRQLQHLLNVHRWNAGQSSIAEDGIFGPVTELAVRSFQRGQGLNETGSADAPTWAALSRQPRHREGAPVASRPSPTQPSSQPSGGSDATNLPAPPLPSAEGGTRLDQIQRLVIESARYELSLGVRETGSSNSGGRVDLYARTAGMSTGYEWCGFFASFNYTQAARRLGLVWAGQHELHSVGKVRAFFLYRSYTQSWTRANLARWEATRSTHQRQGSTRRYMVFQSSAGQRWARSKGLTCEVYAGYGDLPIRAGDYVVWSRGDNGHIGLVEAYDRGSGRLTTIEGNTSNSVRRKVYELSSASARATIDGFGRPAMGDFSAPN